ncbi:hypothetical protein JHD49_06920 [Sulfurimonas sp. SAG-AH-194-C21]|nr:hypothetical protein [Sulfurimonas sp. SAG-AH-194-C21]MDF1883667.1 hypothetical protein [Sulfurimonas sp. SAG-AH-194-C21]
MLGTEAYTQQIGKVAYAYNESNGFLLDGVETFLQKFGWQGLLDEMVNTSHGKDLTKQIKAYQASINDKHKVLVVAHSQGNLFTYEAYNALSSDMQKDFEAISIASPMKADIKAGTDRVDFDNDLVPRIARLGASSPNDIKNNVRVVNWFGQYNPSDSDYTSIYANKPTEDYTAISNIDKIYTNGVYDYEAQEGGVDTASKVHAFTFYMGHPLGEGDAEIIYDPFTNNTLVDGSARIKIMQAISTKLNKLGVCEDKCKDIRNSIQPIGGIIEVSLRWSDPSINMSLSSELGIKDVSASECSSMEHYYLKNKDDVSIGVYGVSVNSSGEVSASSLPQRVILSISTPGAAKVFDFNITAADMLNLGHVADIEITKQGKIETIYTGNNSSGSGDNNSSSSSNNSTSVVIQEYTGKDYVNYVYDITSKLKQAALGPLSNAGILLTDAINFENTVAFYESATSGGGSLLTSGVFYFTSEALSTLKTGNFYVLNVNGGNDIDANDDGIVDTTSTLNLGTIHAVVDEKTLKNENFKVNILTEVVFQLTKELMTEKLNTTVLQEQLDDISTRLLIKDVNGDEKIDYEDILAWQAIRDKDKLLKPYNRFYEPIVQKIYKDEYIYDNVYDLAYGIYLKDTVLYVKDGTIQGTLVGNLDIIKNENTINSITLSGIGSNDFEIDLDGVIRVIQGVTLQTSRQAYYSLNITLNSQYTATLSIDIMSRIMSFTDTSGSARGVTLSSDGTKVFIADGSSGLQIIDISDPINPSIISSLDTPSYAYDVTLSADGTKAFIAE